MEENFKESTKLFFEKIKNEKEKTRKQNRRTFYEMPLYAYNAGHWAFWFADTYEKINKKPYPRNIQREIHIFQAYIFPIFFRDLEWSALEFKSHINYIFKRSLNVERLMKLQTFKFKNDFARKKAERFNKDVILRKRSDKTNKFNNLINLPYIPLSVINNDLMQIYNKKNYNIESILYHYGISNYHKYLQKSKNINFEEAALEVRKLILTLFKEHIKKDENVCIQLFNGIAGNSIRWEPYFNKIKRENYIFAWREYFYKIWELIGATEKIWWTKNPNNIRAPLSSVSKFFNDF